MRIIGLTGGIGCGKSTASNYLNELGFITIDFDELEIPHGKKEICELWSGESRVETSGFKTELQKHGAKAFLISAVR